MNVFLHSDFLLDTAAARRLYHDDASDLPNISEGLAPIDHNLLDGIIADICYHNARRWFIS